MNESITSFRSDQDRLDEFLQHYNIIDEQLRKTLRQSKDVGFSSLVSEFETNGGSKVDARTLRRAAVLRNALVHDCREGDGLLASPTAETVKRLSEISHRLLHPVVVIPLFEKQVQVVSPTHTLAHVFTQIRYRDFSQFPVYEGDTFKALLTENGLTRWIAKHVTSKLTLVELEEVYVIELLHEEEQRENCEFAPSNTPVDSVRKMFKDNQLLEAVLITSNGSRTRDLTGIITRWDMLQL